MAFKQVLKTPKDLLPNEDYAKAYQELRTSLLDQYLKRIQSKLAFPMPINIGGKPTHFGTSEGYANNYQLNKDLIIEHSDMSNEVSTILETHGRLLLIGDAGSGKTVILLIAARFILEDKEATQLPLILNLATWRSSYTFEEWYERNVAESFNLSHLFAKTLIQKRAILPFFDGYDEILETERTDLLQKMRTYFGSDKANRFIISSRKLAYQDATDDAPVYAEYEVKPLTIEQIRTALTDNTQKFGSENALLNEINTHPHLQEAVLNPFYLNTASFLFDKGIKMDFKAVDTEGAQLEIVETFVESQVPNVVEKKYLGFLARKMNDNNLVLFELLKIQPSWLVGIKNSKLILFLTFSLASCLIFNLFFMIFLGVTGYIYNYFLQGIYLGLRFGAICGLFIGVWGYSTLGNSITTNDIQTWDYKTFKRNWKVRLMTHAITGFLGGLFASITLGIKFGLILGMLGGIIGMFKHAGTYSVPIISLKNAYQRFWCDIKYQIWDSISLAIIIILILLIISIRPFTLNALLGFILTKQFILVIILTSMFAILTLIIINGSLILHVIIRAYLKFKHNFPLRVVTFMDKMSNQRIMEDNRVDEKQKDGSLKKRRGATWRFRHKILQDYFATKTF